MTGRGHFPDEDLDAIAGTAAAIMDSLVLVSDLTSLRTQIALECESNPVRSAQVMMCLAAWCDPEETTSTRDRRVDQLVALRAIA